MKLSVLIVSLAPVLAGCTTSYTVIPQIPFEAANLNEVLSGANVAITLTDGSEAEGIGFWAESDVIRWMKNQSLDTIRVSAGSVKTVVVRNHVLGALEGAVISLPSAFGLSLVILRAGLFGRGGGGSPNPFPAAFALTIGGAGALTGIYYGATSGHKYVYEFYRLPESIRFLVDSTTQSAPVRHVVVTLAQEEQNSGVFGTLISDTPVVILRVSKDRMWEIPPASNVRIQSIHSGNFHFSGISSGWIVTRKDQSTIVADSLTSYKSGILEIDHRGSRIVIGIDELQSLERVSGRISEASSQKPVNVLKMSNQLQESTLMMLVRQEHERNARK
ncbi:MAG: hypothetical protein WBD36_07460 [Bacteroidota bacterium]